MRLKALFSSFLPSSFARSDQDSPHESSYSSDFMNYPRSCEIEVSSLGEPASSPRPVDDERVDEDVHPDTKQDVAENLGSFSHGS